MLDQPVSTCIRVVTLISFLAAPVGAAEPQRPSISESARKEAVRLVSADARALVTPPNYPQSFKGPVPTSRLGRQVVAGTAGAVGGLFAGAVIGARIATTRQCGECSLQGLMIGAPIGAIAGAITAVVLTR